MEQLIDVESRPQESFNNFYNKSNEVLYFSINQDEK
jgi:hypothetical protein